MDGCQIRNTLERTIILVGSVQNQMVVLPYSRLFFCAFGPKLRSQKNSAFRQKTDNFTRNSGKISQKLRYSETFSIAQYIRFFKNSAQAAKTQIKFRKTQLFGYICMFLYQKSAQTKSLSLCTRISSIVFMKDQFQPEFLWAWAKGNTNPGLFLSVFWLCLATNVVKNWVFRIFSEFFENFLAFFWFFMK